MNKNILLIEDDPTFRDTLETVLEGRGLSIVWAAAGAEGIRLYQKSPHTFPLVICDYLLPDYKGSEIRQHLKRSNPDQLFLFTSGHSNPEYLKDQLSVGADGFIDKMAPASEMRDTILKIFALYQKERAPAGYTGEASQAQMQLLNHGFVGRSRAMTEMLKPILAAKGSPFPTMIVGATGVGKELVARALVPEGKKLISISGAEYVGREHLVESDLFGYVKGAFTDAKQDTLGLIAQANDNVLFLDELHLMPLHIQGKLLRFFEEMKYRKVGDSSGKLTSVQFKLITAVQPDLAERVSSRRFVRDLVARIATLTVQVPCLKDRPEDIDLLALKFQDDFNAGKDYKKQKQLRMDTVEMMKQHEWPENVRGLRNAVLQMMTNCDGNLVRPSDFRQFLMTDILRKNQGTNLRSLGEVKRDSESETIKRALEQSRTRGEAAVRAGVPLTTFLRRLTKYEINADLFLGKTKEEAL